MPDSLHDFHSALSGFNLSVEDPVVLTFKDGQRYQVDERVLKRGNKMLLSCQVDGLPIPNISWWWKISNDKHPHDSEENPRIIDRPKNATLEISRAGLYDCSAENRYGSTSRKFRVRYEQDYLPIAISIPPVAVLASFIFLLVWWLRNRTINVSLYMNPDYSRTRINIFISGILQKIGKDVERFFAECPP